MRKINLAILFLVLANRFAFGTIPIEYIKDLDLTKAGYKDLNPLHAVPWTKGILENHGEMLGQKDPIRQLILLLFHRAGTFDPSTLKGNLSVVPYLQPYVLGQFLGAMKAGKEKDFKLHITSDEKDPAFQVAVQKKGKMLSLAKKLRDDPRFYRVMLSLLWAKAQSKEDFEQFYAGVREYVPGAVRKIRPGWKESRFTEADSEERPPLENYDRFLYWAETKHNAGGPELENQATAFSDAGSFSDCGEMSLRNWFKLILDDNGEYNLKVLRDLGAEPEVIRFFGDFKTRKSQKQDEARNKWANVTIRRNGIVYVKDGYELEVGAQNMFALIKALLPGSKATDWQELANEVDAARKKNGLSTYTMDKFAIQAGFGDIHFTIKGFAPFVWHFQAGHFFVAPNPQGNLGAYPLDTISDIAVYYTLTPGKPSDLLYQELRLNEAIERAFRYVPRDADSDDMRIALLNRLSTDDAIVRMFAANVDTSTLARLLKRKESDFKRSYAYLNSLLSANRSADLTLLISTPWYQREVEHYLFGFDSLISSGGYSFDGDKVVTTDVDATRIWDAARGTQIHLVPGQVSTVWHPDGKQVILRGFPDSFVLNLGDFTLRDFKGGWINEVSPDGTRAITVEGFDRELGKGKVRLWDFASGETLHSLLMPNAAYGASFSPEGKMILTTDRDGATRLWDSKSGKELHVLYGDKEAEQSIIGRFSPDGTKVLTAPGYTHEPIASVTHFDTTVRLWDSRSGELLRTLVGHSHLVYSGVFSPDGTKAVTASRDKTARVWDVATGKELQVFKGHMLDVTSAAFSPNGRTILTLSDDMSAKIWDIATGKVLQTLAGHTEKISAAVFSPDGKHVLTTSNDKTARIWKVLGHSKDQLHDLRHEEALPPSP